MRISVCLSVFLAATAVSSPVTADEIRDTLVVTASRIPVPISTTGSSVSVIDREQIDARQSVFAVDLLQNVPGFAVSRSGSIGSQTQVRVRGAEANQVLVLIDGIRANDPAGNDEFAFQDLTTWDVDRIEIVRGPQSALWGSDALAGVINVISRPPTEEFSAGGFAEGGAFDTYSLGGRVAGAVLGARAGFSLSRVTSNGSNASRSGSEDDGYANTTAALTLAGSPQANLNLNLVGRYTESNKEFDATDYGSPDPTHVPTFLPADSSDESRVKQGYFGAGGTLKLLDDRWTQALRAAWTTTDTDTSDNSGDLGSTAADIYGLYYQTSWQFTPGAPDSPGNSVTFAAVHEQQDFQQRGPAYGAADPNQDQEQRTTGAVLEFILSPLAQTSMSFSARYDHNSAYDSVATYRATTAWMAESTRTRLHASYGTGQKAPTFIERYGYYPDQFVGNPDLKPETSKGWETGIDQPLFDDRISLGATYFHENLEDEVRTVFIDAPPPVFFLSTTENLDGTSKRRGVEITASARATAGLRFSGSYTYLDATEPDQYTGAPTREIRRPRHGASLNGDWRLPGNKANVNLNLTYVGDRDDTFFGANGSETVNLDAYYLASLAVSYRVTAQTRVYARAENLLNENYEDVYGYNTPGVAGYAGFGWSF